MMTCNDCIHYDVCKLNGSRCCRDLYGVNLFKDKSLIVELPCKVGDTVYFVFPCKGIVPQKVRRIQLSKNGWFIVCKCGAIPFNIIGKSIFLTEAEALKKLEGMK